MKYAVLIAIAGGSLLAQNGSVLPPDLQEQVDRIRRESHLKTDPPPPPEAPAAAAAGPLIPVEQPEEEAADVADMQAILAGSAPVPLAQLEHSSEMQATTEQKLREMIGAAQRRVERGEAKLARAREAAEHGQLDADALKNVADELSHRRETLDLANERAALLGELIEMAQAETIRPGAARLVNAATLRYDGSGRLIRPAEFAALSASFVRKFSRPLPVSAWGESMTHVELGFDHRGRIDVAVSPDSREGLFIRGWLEKQRIPYFAFRRAMPGRATGPHIHIGPGSTRFVRASLRGGGYGR